MRANYTYLCDLKQCQDCTYPESTEQTNSIMLELILEKYSRAYRKYLRSLKKE